jgi:ethanolamine ammonia-lyase large subunit
MSSYAASIGGHRYVFPSLAALMAAASALKTGDRLAGVAAENAEERVGARHALAEVPLRTFLQEALIPYEDDDVTRLILDTHDLTAFAPISSLTLGEFRDWLLSDAATSPTLTALMPGLTPEIVAGVSKLMRNQDLIAVARKCSVISAFRTTLGLPGRIATRLQPNHPTDDRRGILAATLDGLLMASGDALIGINPATDNLETCYELLTMLDDLRERYAIPTQSCVLTHVTNAIRLMEQGAPTDIVFQSIAGSQKANASFGVGLGLLAEAHDAARSLGRGTVGDNAMYFETGQGAALSSEANFGLDQQTIEARAYGVARAFSPFMVNTVVGFIGPEYIDGSSQIVRAGLEDHLCGKLLGLPMGCDACYTNHASIDQNDMDVLATLLAVSGATFLIAVPGGEDVMLNYQSLSFHDILYLRSVLGLRPAPEFEPWLAGMGLAAASGQFALADLGQPRLEGLLSDLGSGS